jgi:hypothetical protein
LKVVWPLAQPFWQSLFPDEEPVEQQERTNGQRNGEGGGQKVHVRHLHICLAQTLTGPDSKHLFELSFRPSQVDARGIESK